MGVARGERELVPWVVLAREGGGGLVIVCISIWYFISLRIVHF